MSDLGDKLREQAQWADEHPEFKSAGLIIAPTKMFRVASSASQETEAIGMCDMHLKARVHEYFFAPRELAS